ncbi:hypothetical protein R3P38DRAFT_3227993 [Favolaschia claudopus]|uniref:Uncharacterized protein n=1 Tax=Favolaschia claudopus TaxID=2862362 RepID=A0AAV9ZRE9_9AGAR
MVHGARSSTHQVSRVTKYRPQRLLSAVTFSLPLLLSTLSALGHSYVRTTFAA